LSKKYWRKKRAKNIYEIDTCSQFHQHFLHAFLVQNFWRKISNTKYKIQLCNLVANILYKKRSHKTLKKLTPGLAGLNTSANLSVALFGMFSFLQMIIYVSQIPRLEKG